MEAIKLPKSGPHRFGCAHLKLLTHVAAYWLYGSPFTGTLLRAGAIVPTASLPSPAVLIECLPPTGKRVRGDMLWILWKLDDSRTEWHEVGRAQSADRSWVMAIHPLALRAMHGPHPPQPQIPLLTEQIVRSIDRELEAIAPSLRGDLLSAIDAEIQGRLAQVLV